MFEGLNTITRRGVIGTSTPVFGLRPIRSPLERTTKDPKEEELHRLALRDGLRHLLQDHFHEFGGFGPGQADSLINGL